MPVQLCTIRISRLWLILTLFLAPAIFAQQQPIQQPPAAQTSAPPAQPGALASPGAEQPPPPPLPPPGQKLTSNQLDELVAPIALYPDPLISQILVAATYPTEVTLAARWLNQHPELKGQDLNSAAQQQPWDPSVRALVAFPGVLRRLNQDKVWTTNLGNAVLAQQADVMKAVQRMRRAAKAAGKLSGSRQMKVVETTDSGETVIEIVPANPNVLFVPVYNPVWIWGPPLWYPYPRWYWGPPPAAAGVWFGFGGAIAVGAYFGPAWGGWGGWGWSPGWVNNTVVVNNTFINNTSVNTTSLSATNVNTAPSAPGATATGSSPAISSPGNTGNAASPSTATTANASTANVRTGSQTNGTPTSPSTPATANASTANVRTGSQPNGTPTSLGGSQTSVWQHDPSHRQGVPYPNAEVAQRFHAPPPTPAQGVPPRAQAANTRTGPRPLARAGARPAGAKAPSMKLRRNTGALCSPSTN